MTTNSDPLVRLELLISHIADLVWPSRDLVNALRLGPTHQVSSAATLTT